MSHIHANGLSFHYLQVGSGPNLIMLHGLMGNQAIWHLRMVPMLRSMFRVTTYDLRGHGRSDIPPTGYTTGDMATDLCALMDALHIERAHVVGHSLGADVALHFALRHPDRVDSMMLIEAGIPALVNDRKNENWAGWAYWARILEEFTGRPVPSDKRNDIDYMVRQSLDIPIIFGPASGLPRKKEAVLRLLDTTTVVEDYEVVGDLTLENLATIPHRKLLIYDGSSPYLTTYQSLRQVLTNATFVVLPPTRHQHFGPLEVPDVLVQHLTDFLQTESAASCMSRVGR